MLLTEFDEELFAEVMREEGKEGGREEGEARAYQLFSKLMEEKRPGDLERAIGDKGYRNALYERYGL